MTVQRVCLLFTLPLGLSPQELQVKCHSHVRAQSSFDLTSQETAQGETNIEKLKEK